MREIVGTLSAVAGRRIRYLQVPELPQRLLGRFVMGLPERVVDAMVGLMGKLRGASVFTTPRCDTQTRSHHWCAQRE